MKKIFEKRFCIYEIFKLFITRRIHFIKVLFSKKKRVLQGPFEKNIYPF